MGFILKQVVIDIYTMKRSISQSKLQVDYYLSLTYEKKSYSNNI